MKTDFYPVKLPTCEIQEGSEVTQTTTFNQLVSIRNPTNNSPLFCIHPSGGDIGIYRKLATKLDRSRSIWGVQSRLQCGAPTEMSSLEEMANEYSRIVERQNPKGSIRLLGFSLGGFLATLIAKNLHQSGRHVSFLGLIDSNPSWTSAEEASRRELSVRLFQVFTKFQNIGLLLKKPVETVRAEVETLIDEWFQTKQISAEEVMAKIDALGYIPERQADGKFLLKFAETFLVHVRLLNDFEPPKIDFPLHLWWPSETEKENKIGTEIWASRASAGVTESVITGSHYSIMRGAPVRALAAEVESAIANAEEDVALS